MEENLIVLLMFMYKNRDTSGKYIGFKDIYPNKDLPKPLLKIETDKLVGLGLLEYYDNGGGFGRITEKGIEYVEENLL